MLRLRCKARSGSYALPGLTAHSCLHELQATLASLTGVPVQAQRLLLGFPPRSVDLTDRERRLGELGIHSGKKRRRSETPGPLEFLRNSKQYCVMGRRIGAWALGGMRGAGVEIGRPSFPFSFDIVE